MTYAVKRHLIDDQLRVVRLEAIERSPAISVDYECAVIELDHITVQPLLNAIDVQILGCLENGFQVLVCSEMSFEFCAAIYASLGVVLRYELLFEAKGDDGFTALEQSHLSTTLMAEQTQFI